MFSPFNYLIMQLQIAGIHAHISIWKPSIIFKKFNRVVSETHSYYLRPFVIKHFIDCTYAMRDNFELASVSISPLHVVLWHSLSGTLSDTLRIVFHTHLVLCASMRPIVRNNFTFCFLQYFSNFSSKLWYFITVMNPIFLANSKNSLMLRMRSKLPEI